MRPILLIATALASVFVSGCCRRGSGAASGIYGYERTIYVYTDAHPIPGGAWCSLSGPHEHPYSPIPRLYVYVDGSYRYQEPSAAPVEAPPPAESYSPPVHVASPPTIYVAPPPIQVVTPPVRVITPPVHMASPPARVASPPVHMASPPVPVASPPPPGRAVTPPGHAATPVGYGSHAATPPGHSGKDKPQPHDDEPAGRSRK